MKAIILAAGYATRLYPLTKNFPKPLLEVGGQTILDYLIDQLKTIPELDHAYIITNARFHEHFTNWAQNRAAQAQESEQAHVGLRTDILDDGTTSNDDRLGAIGDLQYVIQARDIHDDILVLAADNIIKFSLQTFINTFKNNPAPHITVRSNPDVDDRKRRGNVRLDENNQVLEFIEKPEKPISEWSVPPFYIYPNAVLPRINEYLDNGGNPDAPGHLMEWLHKEETVFAHKIEGEIIDIGNHESLAEARRIFGEEQ
ncbi:MAG: nucleotidyltransferase family protein [Candidatus Latescibacteria bacterium]|nr:nucleotidyltransferase family protein [Candidatus Latescibacterota bacterium]MBT5831770.1 nucleotidyltransferase family protein [Candidatus Latescibacterota bacterium]